MDLTQLNQRIAVANAESQRINNERAVNIGKKETLEKQLQDAIAHYNNTYGTNITVDSLNSEIERVAREKEAEVSNIESVLSLIKEGRYSEAQQKVSGVVTSEPVVSQPVAPAPAPIVSEPVVPAPAPIVSEPVVSRPTPPNLSGLDTSVEDDIVPPAPPSAPPSTSGVAKPEGVPPTFSEPAVGKPPVVPNLGSPTVTQPSQVTSFNAILNGSQFKPQGM